MTREERQQVAAELAELRHALTDSEARKVLVWFGAHNPDVFRRAVHIVKGDAL